MSKLWDMLADPEHTFYAATVKIQDGRAPLVVVSKPEDTLQEPYVEETFQEEGLVLFFTTADGAKSHISYLIKECNYDKHSMGIVVGSLKEIWKVVDTVNTIMVQEIGRSIRAEVYHMDGDDCVDCEIVFSQWVTKQ